MTINKLDPYITPNADRLISKEQFVEIQRYLGLSNSELALITGLKLGTIEDYKIKSRKQDFCSGQTSAQLLLLQEIKKRDDVFFQKLKKHFIF